MTNKEIQQMNKLINSSDYPELLRILIKHYILFVINTIISIKNYEQCIKKVFNTSQSGGKMIKFKTKSGVKLSNDDIK